MTIRRTPMAHSASMVGLSSLALAFQSPPINTVSGTSADDRLNIRWLSSTHALSVSRDFARSGWQPLPLVNCASPK
jgi:hypothetical protein